MTVNIRGSNHDMRCVIKSHNHTFFFVQKLHIFVQGKRKFEPLLSEVFFFFFDEMICIERNSSETYDFSSIIEFDVKLAIHMFFYYIYKIINKFEKLLRHFHVIQVKKVNIQTPKFQRKIKFSRVFEQENDINLFFHSKVSLQLG